jgi:hypothetical protein
VAQQAHKSAGIKRPAAAVEPEEEDFMETHFAAATEAQE